MGVGRAWEEAKMPPVTSCDCPVSLHVSSAPARGPAWPQLCVLTSWDALQLLESSKGPEPLWPHVDVEGAEKGEGQSTLM